MSKSASQLELHRLIRQGFDLGSGESEPKVTSLGEAVRAHVAPGSVVHVAYSDARPNAALMELARAFRDTPNPGLTLVTAGLVSVQHSLLELGIVNKLVASFAGENYPVAKPSPAVRRALGEGRLVIENWSLWSLIARLVAGALGLSHFPVRSLAGSSIAEEAARRGECITVDLVGSAVETTFVAALRPDVVLLQAVAADPQGNVVMAAPYGESHWGALAARRGVIACVETIISTEELRRVNSAVRIPAHRVLAVCHAPFGSHPYGLYNPVDLDVEGYAEDADFMAEVYQATRSATTFRAWIDEWVLGVDDHAQYVEKVGTERTRRLVAAAKPDAWETEPTAAWVESRDANEVEFQVVATSRQLVARIVAERYEAILAGVGLANLASWAAASELQQRDIDVELMAEIGMFGFAPRPGEPFIFASRNIPTCKLLTDVMGVLGTMVSGPGTRAIGVIGAGQVDATGATNSTFTDSGEFIVGSGGANDVVSASDEVLVTVPHRPGRLVARVPYVTCPGANVKSIVTTFGVFERQPGEDFALVRYLPAAGQSATAAIERIRDSTPWSFSVAPDLSLEPPPSARELALLRAYDPHRVFLRD